MTALPGLQEDPFYDPAYDDKPLFEGEGERRIRDKKTLSIEDHLGKTPKKVRQPDFNPLARKWMDARGWTYARSETTNGAGFTNDLFGFADYVALAPEGVVFVQVTALSKVTEHIAKMRKEFTPKHCAFSYRSAALAALRTPCASILVLGFHQPRGKGTTWEIEERRVTVEDIEGTGRLRTRA